MKNEVMLITYGDSLGKNFKELEQILDEHYQGAIGSVHILPFFRLPQIEDLHQCVMIRWIKSLEIFQIWKE